MTWVCCRGDPARYDRWFGPSVERQRERYGVEVLVVEDPDSIFAAYERARRQAGHEVVAYAHEDVELIDPRASEKVCAAFRELPRAGLLGVVGSSERGRLPWWHCPGTRVGHWIDPRWEEGAELRYTWSAGERFRHEPLSRTDPHAAWEARSPEERFSGRVPAGLLDGLLLAEHRGRLDLPWDTEHYRGWHAYDADRCLQAHAAGWEVWAIDLLVVHHDAPRQPRRGDAVARALQQARAKWGISRNWWRALRSPWA